jgi:hypothetical protein
MTNREKLREMEEERNHLQESLNYFRSDILSNILL